MYTTVKIDPSIDLPHFPDELDHTNYEWQCKHGLDRYTRYHRVTADGRVEKQQKTYREKTEQEKETEAHRWGFNSWDEYTEAYEQSDEIRPESIDYDLESDVDERPPTFYPSEQVCDEVFWGDISYHGTFECHALVQKHPLSYETREMPGGETVKRPSEYALDIFPSYEFRFTQGDLDEVVCIGERSSTEADPINEMTRKIREWREWRVGSHE